MIDIETVIQRVRKMHAKAESARAIGSIAEAETFAAAVAKMLEAHKISMSTIDLAAEDTLDPMGETMHDFTDMGSNKSGTKWATSLTNIVARAHFCRSYTNHQMKGVIFIGRASDRELAIHVFNTLYLAALRMSYEADKAKGHTDSSFRPSWLTGFVFAIRDRYKAQACERAGHMALVRADKEAEAALRAIPGMRFVNSSNNANSAKGRAAGEAAGRGVSLHAAPKFSGAGSSGSRQLSSGSN